MNRLRLLFAIVMWRVQCSFLWPLWRRWVLRTNFMGGRGIDWMPVRCEDCGWAGPLRWACHTYRGGFYDDDDVEPSDECPQCGWELFPE